MFTDFYNLPLEAQNQFIANLVEEQIKKIERKRTDGKESRRKYSRKYNLLKNAARIKVCQIMILNTFDLTLKKVKVITGKKRLSESGICAEDRSGKHSNHPTVPDTDKEEIRKHIKSDCCRGQTKNIYLPLMFMTILEEFKNLGREVAITHKFLVPGHTHMEADTIHALIEKTRKTTTARVDIPRDWANLIRMIPRKPHIITNGDSVLWNKIRWIQYTHDRPDLLRKRTRNLQNPQITPISNKLLGIPENKLKYLQDLQPYIDENSRVYYSQFISTLTVSPAAIDTLTDEEDDIYDSINNDN
ncbi:hypothetical protein QE152_g9306 [Popillia japonica]|uniref:Uncharacterized protein n=1 Tax=Popillia japonica TaxID=7064 RepID=A0AAW1LYS1_POPJA